MKKQIYFVILLFLAIIFLSLTLSAIVAVINLSYRPNEIKTEAFKRIAKYFDCRFWENDCVENDFIDFKKLN